MNFGTKENQIEFPNEDEMFAKAHSSRNHYRGANPGYRKVKTKIVGSRQHTKLHGGGMNQNLLGGGKIGGKFCFQFFQTST